MHAVAQVDKLVQLQIQNYGTIWAGFFIHPECRFCHLIKALKEVKATGANQW